MALVVEKWVKDDIINHDPDGKVDKPTDADYDAFDNYVITNYGETVLDAYVNMRLKSK